jgi:hypothetical protein
VKSAPWRSIKRRRRASGKGPSRSAGLGGACRRRGRAREAWWIRCRVDMDGFSGARHVGRDGRTQYAWPPPRPARRRDAVSSRVRIVLDSNENVGAKGRSTAIGGADYPLIKPISPTPPALSVNGRHAEASRYVREALKRDRDVPEFRRVAMAEAHAGSRRLGGGAQIPRHIVERRPEWLLARALLTICLVGIDQFQEPAAGVEAIRRLSLGFSAFSVLSERSRFRRIGADAGPGVPARGDVIVLSRSDRRVVPARRSFVAAWRICVSCRWRSSENRPRNGCKGGS